MTAFVGVEELHVGQHVLLLEAPLVRGEHILLAVQVDTGNGQAVQPPLGDQPGRDVFVAPWDDPAVLQDARPELRVGLAVPLGRRVAHLYEVVADRLAAVDDRRHHRPHAFAGSVVLGQLDLRRRLLALRHDVADVTGDEREAQDSLGVGHDVVRAVDAAHRVTGDVELVQAEHGGELVDEIGVTVQASRPVLGPRVRQAEGGHVRGVDPEAVRAEEGRHEPPAGRTR